MAILGPYWSLTPGSCVTLAAYPTGQQRGPVALRSMITGYSISTAPMLTTQRIQRSLQFTSLSLLCQL